MSDALIIVIIGILVAVLDFKNELKKNLDPMGRIIRTHSPTLKKVER